MDLVRRNIAVLILAAGQGRRFAADDLGKKVVALFRGVPLVRAVAMAARASRARSVTVVTGPAHVEVAEALHGLGVQIVRNPDYATGMASSLKVGLAAMSSDIAGVLVMLADMPLVRTETLDLLITRFEDRAAAIHSVMPVHDGRRGNPVLIGRNLFAAVETLTGDEGARSLLQKPEIVVELCDVDDPGVSIDIDTLAELEALNQSD